jgi:hypothetical protein
MAKVACGGRYSKPELVLAQEACSGAYNGSAMLRPLADVAHALSPFGWLLADAEFDSERNLIAMCARR